jgi:hypothetical protein
MTASPPKANGSTRPRTPLKFADWRIEATPEPAEEQRTPEPQPEAAETPELVAQAQAEAIRAQAWADAERQRIAAEAEKEAALKLASAEADAVRAKAVEATRRMKLANDKQERQAREDDAASAARIAESNRLRDEAERARVAAAQQARIDEQVEAQNAKVVAKADKKWRKWAIAFYTLCAAVALPVQISAFWDERKPWMAGAPVLLEIAALVVAFGTAAAVANKRPHWHFRLITWVLAFIAASVNLWHGMQEFDPATAVGTALASVFGPGVWDLHEHGRIRKRDGVPTRRERKAQERAAKDEVKRAVAEEAQRAAEKEAAAKAAEEAARKLADRRAKLFPKVWEHAEKLATDLGETAVTEAIWGRAKLDVEGARPGESAEVFRMRNAAEARVSAAREKRSVSGSTQQVASQVLGSKMPRVYNPPARPGRRTKGDVKYAPGASRQASIAAREAAAKKTTQKDPS